MPSPLAASIGVFYDESFVSVVPAAAPLSQPEPEPGSGAFNVAAGSSTLGAALAWAGPPAWAGPCQPRRPPCGAQGCPCPRPAESPLEALFGPRGLGPAAPQPGGPPPHRASASAGQWRRWDLTGTGRGLGWYPRPSRARPNGPGRGASGVHALEKTNRRPWNTKSLR